MWVNNDVERTGEERMLSLYVVESAKRKFFRRRGREGWRSSEEVL